MSRYVEDIVANHQAASRRRAASKPIWDAEIPLAQLVHDAPEEMSESAAAALAKKIGQLLREKLPRKFLDPAHEGCEPGIDELVQKFEETTPESLQADMDRDGDSAADCIDVLLEELYDWADRNRVWLGH